MKQIYVATKARGFLLELFRSQSEYYEFIYDDSKIYETNSQLKFLLSRIVKSKIADHLGIIQRLKINNADSDLIFSYNRFLNCNKDYVIYLENPLALVHYSTYRNKKFIPKLKLKKYFNDPHLKAIICMSKACYDTLKYYFEVPQNIKVDQIYPLIKINPSTNPTSIKTKCHKPILNCLYISSDFNLKGGKDIVKCFNRLKAENINNIKLKIITKRNTIDESTIFDISRNDNIELLNFNFNKEEILHFYNESCIVLNPTRQDSFPMVLLEAIKSGNTILTTDLYAIPEMVKNEFNGFLTEPRFRFFNKNNLANDKVWNNRKKTIYSNYVDENIVDFLFSKITYLNNHREELERLVINSYNVSRQGDFCEEFIKNKWNQLFEEISQ